MCLCVCVSWTKNWGCCVCAVHVCGLNSVCLVWDG